MKKILLVVLSLFALSVQARETVTIIYGFSAADGVANYGRNLADEANKIQDKYTFTFDAKPGAGQAVAVNYVKNTPNTIFMTSGAFWVRPNFFPNESWNVHDFKPLITQCTIPFSVASAKYKSWKDVPTDRPLSIGTSGLGVVSHLTALQIQKQYPQIKIIPFKSTTDAIVAGVGGQVDFAIGFLGDMAHWTGDDNKVKLNILGITGPKPVAGFPNLSSQGFPTILSKMNSTHNLMVPTSWSKDKTNEIRNILVKAENTRSVRIAYTLDYCEAVQIPENKLQPWWDDQNTVWTNLTKGVKIDQ